MKIKRKKRHGRIMRFFRMSFGVKEPYHVLVDGTFLTGALQHKIHVKEQLPKVLTGKATPMVTECVLAELRGLGERALGAAIIAKGYYRLKCGHEKAIGASDCIYQQIGEKNTRHLCVASQDIQLVRNLRQVPGVPLLRLAGQVPRLEEPSSASTAAAKAGEKKRMGASDWEKPRLPVLTELEKKRAEAAANPKKRKGAKAPNPLSCKKARRVLRPQATPFAEPTRAKRVRSRCMGTRTRAEVEALRSGGTSQSRPVKEAPQAEDLGEQVDPMAERREAAGPCRVSRGKNRKQRRVA
mmetsp:Transcript_36627/g.85221  ORF Transcript_36627/g.85221 Transcript_36627/m.85221 type:complete len:297 (+) Transcript_36627:68-958(+)